MLIDLIGDVQRWLLIAYYLSIALIRVAMQAFVPCAVWFILPTYVAVFPFLSLIQLHEFTCGRGRAPCYNARDVMSDDV